jgi:serine protease Do
MRVETANWKRLATFILLGTFMAAASAVRAAELPDFTQLVKKVGPSVVNISTKQTVKRQGHLPKGLDIPNLPEDSPWGDLFRHFFGDGGDNGAPEEYEARSLGSGFIIGSDGYILTNNHVVDGADEIIVRLNDRRELNAKVIGADKRSDVALLKVDATGLPVVKIGKMDDVQVGQWVLAIGSPFGFDHSVSVGVVSALGRSLPSESYVPFIQTDVAINPGNSGGPLFNLEGQVIGINSQIYSRTGGYMGLSFAIPIDVAMDVVAQLKATGHVARGWLGVLIQDVTRQLAESFGMSKPMGALVAQVMDNSPAAKAGLKVGDVIVEFNGTKIIDSSKLPPLVGRAKIGDEADIKVIRDGKEKTLTVKIGELPSEEELATTQGAPETAGNNRLDISVKTLTAEQRKELKVGNGVIVTDIDEGAAYDAGIRRGDVILRLNNVDVKNAAQFDRLIDSLPEGKSVPVLVRRRSGPLFLALKVPKE